MQYVFDRLGAEAASAESEHIPRGWRERKADEKGHNEIEESTVEALALEVENEKKKR